MSEGVEYLLTVGAGLGLLMILLWYIFKTEGEKA